jgi:hypothetical protein
MIKVVIESPSAGNVKRNIKYARECLLDSLKRGEAPIASHLLYTQVLNDDIPEERLDGIYAGFAWLCVADKHIFYVDYGMSQGMRHAERFSEEHNIEREYRKIK